MFLDCLTVHRKEFPISLIMELLMGHPMGHLMELLMGHPMGHLMELLMDTLIEHNMDKTIDPMGMGIKNLHTLPIMVL